MPKIAVIGGSGIYDPEIFKSERSVKLSTPYGSPSGAIEVGSMGGVEVAFFPRHGKGHAIPPHKVNYRANIWALKELGVERIIAASACGSLKEDYTPGSLVVVDQYIDFTKKREYTFYDGGQVHHVSLADPFCRPMSDLCIDAGKKLGLNVHPRGTYICIEGPRFSTRAESKMFRTFADIIGMTLVPECQLARELEMCYVTLAMVTDYDVWQERPVSAQEVLEIMGKNVSNVRKIMTEVLPKLPATRNCECASALKFAKV
jgi:5'-methylthioadenosine phosphorylase